MRRGKTQLAVDGHVKSNLPNRRATKNSFLPRTLVAAFFLCAAEIRATPSEITFNMAPLAASLSRAWTCRRQ